MISNSDQYDDYEKLFNMSLDMLCIAGTDGYFKKVNPSFNRILGYSEEEILSKPFIDFVHRDDINATLKEIEKLKKGEFTVNFENRYQHLDGSYRILSWSASVESGNGRLYCIARDVTEERNTKHKLLQIEEALNKETIVAMTDIQGTIVEVNEKFCEISGYSKAELIGQNHRILNSGKHSKDFFREMWKTISSGKTWSGMIENRKKDGEHYFVQSIITPIFDTQGKIANYFAIRFDTTKHIKIKNELNKTLSILNEMGSIAKVGGWELDVATGELTWTDETFKILEVEKKMDQKPVLPEGLDLFTPEYKPIIELAVSRAMEFGEPYSLELEAQTAKGNVLWVYTNGKANYLDGKIISLSGTIQDINAQKIAEQKYERERQKSIQNAKLASLGELSAGIAHEINNPLSIVYGTAQLMLKQLGNPEELSSHIEEIKKSCNRISRIVKSLKKYSRTSDQQELGLHRLIDIVNEAMILTDANSKRNQTKISIDCQTENSIVCDEVEIEQVIVNLINNAIDAVKETEEKWVRLVVSEEDNYIYLKVMDSGPGVSLEAREKLFDPFFSTKKTGEGTGLGLSITKGILDEHGANIFLESDSLHTSFTIKFKKQLGELSDH